MRKAQTEKARAYAKVIKEMNVVKANDKPKKDANNTKKEMSKREKALEFAKQIKKPVKPAKSVCKDNRSEKDVIDHMTYLEEQHKRYQEKVRGLTYN